jgi:hypothetical protein
MMSWFGLTTTVTNCFAVFLSPIIGEARADLGGRRCPAAVAANPPFFSLGFGFGLRGGFSVSVSSIQR